MLATHDNIILIYKWFSAAMRRAGRKDSFPKGTDPRKTYKYRALQSFAKKIEEWEFDEATTKIMVDSVVKYGKRNKLLSKGAMLLSMGSILDICYKEIEAREERLKQALQSIKFTKHYLDENDLNSVRALISSRALGGISNLAHLIDSGKISPEYLAVSKVAYAALHKIDREGYPNDRELLKLRARYLLDQQTRKELGRVLGSDLNTVGLSTRRITCSTT
jgi:hypothetical protein